MKKIWITCFLFLCISGISHQVMAAQKDLKSKLALAKSDTERVRHLLNEAENLRQNDLSLAKEYTFQALTLSRKIHFARGLAGSYMAEGANFEMEQNYNKAMASFVEAARIDDSIHNEKQLATVYLRMGEVFDFQHNREQAFKYYRTALDLYKKYNDSANLINVYIDMANDFSTAKQLDSSLLLLNQALKICIVKDQKGQVLGSIGSTYDGMGKHKEALEQYQKLWRFLMR